jgi:hypothetical protein
MPQLPTTNQRLTVGSSLEPASGAQVAVTDLAGNGITSRQLGERSYRDILLPLYSQVDATIAVDTASTGMIDLGSYTLIGVFLPSNFVASTLTFRSAPTLAGTPVLLYDALGSLVQAVGVASRLVSLESALMFPARFIEIITSNTQTTDAKTLNLILKSL